MYTAHCLYEAVTSIPTLKCYNWQDISLSHLLARKGQG
jgi:hypothetical protein